MADRRLRLSAAVAAGLIGFAGASAAVALPAAQIDQQLRPDFGLLLRPPPRPAYQPSPWRHHGPRYERIPYGQGYYSSQPQPVLAQSITVDCGDPRGGPDALNQALAALADGGLLFIRGGAVCHESLEVDHPVSIVGEAAPLFQGGSGQNGPGPFGSVLAPPPGAPCIRIAPGVRGVEIRDLTLEADRAGRSACIEATDADVTVAGTRLRYLGDAAAIYAQGGRLTLRDTTVETHSNDAAIQTGGTVVDFQRLKVEADVRGLDITPGPGSLLSQVGVIDRGRGPPGSTGLTVRSFRGGGGALNIRNVLIRGFLTGLYVDREAEVQVFRTRILHSRWGIVSDFGRVEVRESVFWTEEGAGYFSGGRAVLVQDRFVNAAPRVDRNADLLLDSNWLFMEAGCGRIRPAAGLYCRSGAPTSLGDEREFGDARLGWSVDAYEEGYRRDGPILPVCGFEPRGRDGDRGRDDPGRDDRARDDRGRDDRDRGGRGRDGRGGAGPVIYADVIQPACLREDIRREDVRRR